MEFRIPWRPGDGAVRWLLDRPLLADTALAALLAVVSVTTVLSLSEAIDDSQLTAPGSVPAWLLVFGPILAVPFRRLAPVAAVTAGAVAQAALWVTSLPDFYLAMAFLLYSAAAYGGRRGERASWLTTVALSAFTLLGILAGAAPVYAVAIVTLFSVAASAMGVSAARKRAYTEAVEAQVRDAARSRQADRDRALTEERNRIARELHDVVAHGLSVIVVQAAAARRILDRDPAGAGSALDQIEQTGRNSLTEMRQVLNAIRTDPADSWRPAPGLADLDELVAEVAKTGLDVTLSHREDPVGAEVEALPTTIDVTAYRVVQEALTNVLKHGGKGAQAVIEIDRRPDSLELSIVDNGRGAAADDLGGFGLRGMQERVEVFGGRFSARPRIGGGFAVEVSLPVEVRLDPSAPAGS